MRLTFQVSVELDADYLRVKSEQAATSQNRSVWMMPVSHYVDQIFRVKVDECENALADALMHKDGIVAGSVTVIRQES